MIEYRIHGDNIVECERIANIIISSLSDESISYALASPSTVDVDIVAKFDYRDVRMKMELLPGFNKNSKRRWERNIFDPLKAAGSLFDETPDAIITRINGNEEQIILAIEFCSALQAGNQAWQRSARAFSTGRTGCPYLYIVDFVKYELESTTRKRKALRFPNPAVPYSYVNHSKTTGNFIAQLYVKSEEFDKARDLAISDFDESNFANDVLGKFIVKRMLEIDTSEEEERILQKNINVVQFLSHHFDSSSNFMPSEWNEIYNLPDNDIVNYCVKNCRFGFHKTIASKSQHGALSSVIKIVDQFGVGFASRDLPFGIIPADKRKFFFAQLSTLYPTVNQQTLNDIGSRDEHLIVAIMKGFKPKGDDNRPDRGLLPLATMLSSTNADIMTIIYGPMLESNLKLLESNPLKLAEQNGLWKSVLSLSNYVLIDVPVIAKRNYATEKIYNTTPIKEHYIAFDPHRRLCIGKTFSNIPINYGEDDVDTAIHYLFSHLLSKHCFEGMCNPPGGDWSGFSLIIDNYENRWLSLPRVSDAVCGKRPDHIIELFGVFCRPLLLSIESKERSADLESDVGTKLVAYIEELMNFIPSATRRLAPQKGEWIWGNKKVPSNDFEIMSAAAYLKKYAESNSEVFVKKCELLFIMDPITLHNKMGWKIEIIPSTERSAVVKRFIIDKYKLCGDNQFILY